MPVADADADAFAAEFRATYSDLGYELRLPGAGPSDREPADGSSVHDGWKREDP